MRDPKRVFAAVALLGGLLALAGCEMPAARSPQLRARCTQLFYLWYRYDGVMTAGVNDGEGARAVLAHYRCEQGRFDVGMKELASILRRNKIPIPRPGAPLPTPVIDEDF